MRTHEAYPGATPSCMVCKLLGGSLRGNRGVPGCTVGGVHGCTALSVHTNKNAPKGGHDACALLSAIFNNMSRKCKCCDVGGVTMYHGMRQTRDRPVGRGAQVLQGRLEACSRLLGFCPVMKGERR